MNFSILRENPIIFLSWITAIGLFLSLTEATLKLRYQSHKKSKRREKMISRLYPNKLA